MQLFKSEAALWEMWNMVLNKENVAKAEEYGIGPIYLQIVSFEHNS